MLVHGYHFRATFPFKAKSSTSFLGSASINEAALFHLNRHVAQVLPQVSVPISPISDLRSSCTALNHANWRWVPAWLPAVCGHGATTPPLRPPRASQELFSYAPGSPTTDSGCHYGATTPPLRLPRASQDLFSWRLGFPTTDSRCHYGATTPSLRPPSSSQELFV